MHSADQGVCECRPLLAVAKEQFVYEFKDVSGSLLGFWSPQYFGSSLTVPGFHLHFLSTDKQHGGHVVDVLMQQGTAYIQPVSEHRSCVENRSC